MTSRCRPTFCLLRFERHTLHCIWEGILAPVLAPKLGPELTVKLVHAVALNSGRIFAPYPGYQRGFPRSVRVLFQLGHQGLLAGAVPEH